MNKTSTAAQGSRGNIAPGQALKAVFTYRLHLAWSRPDAEELRTDAQADGGRVEHGAASPLSFAKAKSLQLLMTL